MNRLRILQVFNRYIHPGGEENSVYRIGDALQEVHDVEYFLGSTQELLGNNMASRLFSPVGAFYNIRAARRLKRYQAVGRFDIWQIHNVLPGLSPAVYQVAFSLGVPVVHFLHNYRMGCVNGLFLNHGSPCERCIHGSFWPAFRTGCWHNSRLISGAMALITLRIRQLGTFHKVSAWVALSQIQKEKHIQIGLPKDKIHIVPHFYQPKWPAPPPCADGDVLFLGRLSPEKGVAQLLYAWKLVRALDRKLMIAGDGPELLALRGLSRNLGLTNVEFLGFLKPDSQREIWAKTAFSVIPSIMNDSFPLSFLESWANARPFVANRIGALAEVVEEGRNGLLAEPFSPESLAAGIRALLADSGRCIAMGAEGREKILGEFNKSLWLKRMNNIYKQILPGAFSAKFD